MSCFASNIYGWRWEYKGRGTGLDGQWFIKWKSCTHGFWYQHFQHLGDADEAPDFSDLLLVQTKRKLLLWLWNSACMTPSQLLCSLNSSALFDSTTKNFSLYTLLVCFPATFCLSFCLSTFSPLHSCIVYFLTFSVNAALTLLLSSPTPSHLFFSFIIPPQLFLSHCLYSFWQAYVRELVVKSITIVLHRAIFGGMTWQMSVEIYWCPSSLLYFFMLSATALVASLTKGVFQKSDVTACPP